MGTRRFLLIICLLAASVVLNGCGSFTAPPTAVPTVSPLPDFPLTVGSYWVYSHKEYDPYHESAGCCMTIMVVHSRTEGSYRLTQLRREMSFTPSWGPFWLSPGDSEFFWYATDELGRVYYLPSLLPSEAIANTELTYLFPVNTDGCLFQAVQEPESINCKFAIGPLSHETPAGSFEACYWIVTPYLSGSVYEMLCDGVGFVAEKYDHAGDPYGNETTLVDYWLAPP
jgi:hypothetical protein